MYLSLTLVARTSSIVWYTYQLALLLLIPISDWSTAVTRGLGWSPIFSQSGEKWFGRPITKTAFSQPQDSPRVQSKDAFAKTKLRAVLDGSGHEWTISEQDLREVLCNDAIFIPVGWHWDKSFCASIMIASGPWGHLAWWRHSSCSVESILHMRISCPEIYAGTMCDSMWRNTCTVQACQVVRTQKHRSINLMAFAAIVACDAIVEVDYDGLHCKIAEGQAPRCWVWFDSVVVDPFAKMASYIPSSWWTEAPESLDKLEKHVLKFCYPWNNLWSRIDLYRWISVHACLPAKGWRGEKGCLKVIVWRCWQTILFTLISESSSEDFALIILVFCL